MVCLCDARSYFISTAAIKYSDEKRNQGRKKCISAYNSRLQPAIVGKPRCPGHQTADHNPAIIKSGERHKCMHAACLFSLSSIFLTHIVQEPPHNQLCFPHWTGASPHQLSQSRPIPYRHVHRPTSGRHALVETLLPVILYHHIDKASHHNTYPGKSQHTFPASKFILTLFLQSPWPLMLGGPFPTFSYWLELSSLTIPLH